MTTMTLLNGAVSQGAYTVSVSTSGLKKYLTETYTGMGGNRVFDRIDIDGTTTIIPPSQLPNGGYWPIGSKLTVYCEWWVNGDGDVVSGYTFTIDIYDFPETAGISWNGVLLPGCSIKNESVVSGIKSWDLLFCTATRATVDSIIQFAMPVSTGVSVSGTPYVLSPAAPGSLYIPDDDTYTNCYMSGASVEHFGDWFWVSVHIDQSGYNPA